MAGFDWGAMGGGAQQGLEQLVAERLLQEKLALAQRQQQAEEEYRRASLAEQAAGRQQQGSQFDRRLGFDQQQWSDQAPERAATVRLHGVQADKGVYELGRQQQTDTNQDAADAELLQKPDTAGLVRFRRAGIPITATDPNDVTGSVEHGRALERIKASGDQNVRSAAAGRDARTVTIKTVDENGQPVTKVVPIGEAVGQEFGAQPTADQRNRESAYGRAGNILNAIDELSARINTQGGVIAKITGAAERAAAQANLSDDVAEYEAMVSGFTPLIARSLGHTGVLTEQDVQSAREILPKVTDSKSVRDRKIARVRSLIHGMSGPEGAAPPPPAANPVRKFNPKTGKLE